MGSLRAFPIELLSRAKADRIAYFRDKIIGHPHLIEAREQLCRAIWEPASAGLIAVYGPSGVGKTTLRLHVERRVTEALRAQLEEDRGRLAVIGLEAVAGESGDFNWRDFYKRLLWAASEPLVDQKVLYTMPGEARPGRRNVVLMDRATAPELRYAVEQMLQYRRPAAVLVDEAQHFKRVASGRRLSDQLDTLKSLASLTRVVHVLLGTYELLAVTELSGQLNRRTIDIHFERYHVDRAEDVRAFRSVVDTLQGHLPIAEPPELGAWWEQLYEGSLGCVGVLKDWLTRTLAMVLEKDTRTLKRGDLESQAFRKAKLVQMAREIKEGEERLTDNLGTANQLRRLLGMGSDMVVSGVEEPKFAASGSAAGAGRQRRRRVGERSPVRDTVGGVRNDG
jgi:hypothetical protein